MPTSPLPSAPTWTGRTRGPQPRIGRPLLVAAVVSSVALAAVAVLTAPLQLGAAPGSAAPSTPAAGPAAVSQTDGVRHGAP